MTFLWNRGSHFILTVDSPWQEFSDIDSITLHCWTLLLPGAARLALRYLVGSDWDRLGSHFQCFISSSFLVVEWLPLGRTHSGLFIFRFFRDIYHSGLANMPSGAPGSPRPNLAFKKKTSPINCGWFKSFIHHAETDIFQCIFLLPVCKHLLWYI